jgi:hypothetical protein
MSFAAATSLADPLFSESASRRVTPRHSNPDVRQPLPVIVGPGSTQKKALVLSPFLWDFHVWDDGSAVRDILASTRGYEGEVTFLSNAATSSTDVALAAFTGWDAYDVVHVASHGARICDDDSPCRGVLAVILASAFLPPDVSDDEISEKLGELNQPGVEIVKSTKGRLVGVNADFFRAASFGDTVIFVNSCHLFGGQANDLIDALTGTSNVVFGWTEVVHSDDAYHAAVRLYEELSEGGYPAAIAYEKVGDLRTGSPTEHGPSPTLRMAERPEGGDLQIRDVVTLLHPATGQKLTDDDRVEIEGVSGDGEPDAAPFLVQVDGAIAEHASDMLLVVSVDGVSSDPVQVSSGTVNENDQWIIEGTIPLGYDLEDDEPVTFLATVELVSEGESEHESGAILTGADWTFVSEGQSTKELTIHGVDTQAEDNWTAQAQFALDGDGGVFGQGMASWSGSEISLVYNDEELHCIMSEPFEGGFVFDLTGQLDGGVLHLETENLEPAEFSATTCEGVEEADLLEALLLGLAIVLETTVPFEHEATQDREHPVSGPIAYEGVVVGSFDLLRTWTNTIRKEGCPVGAADNAC